MAEQDIVAVAMTGYNSDQVHPLFVNQHGEHAAVLLETGSSGHSYPYFVLCSLADGEWREAASGNTTGWYQTQDDAGVVAFWDEVDGLDEPVEVEFKGQRWPAQVRGGVLFAAWWDELDPGNLLVPHWPEVVRPGGSHPSR